MKRIILASLLLAAPNLAMADGNQNRQSGQDTQNVKNTQGDFLIKFRPGRMQLMQQLGAMADQGGQVEDLGDNWVHVQAAPQQLTQINSDNLIEQLNQHPDIEYAQPNYRLRMIESYESHDPVIRQLSEDMLAGRVVDSLLPKTLISQIKNLIEIPGFSFGKKIPEIPTMALNVTPGTDPRLNLQWGMQSMNATEAWKKVTGSKKMIVAVIDTGVDYTHEDLAGNLWHNPGEIANNQIDDDKNGFIDDVIGWDFAGNTNKPYDVTSSTFQMFLGGGNPGHGTHCAGNVGAVGNNSKGISGASPNVSIMALRFLNEKGQGSTATAVKAINYAVANGAKILSNSWGSEGDDPREDNRALKSAITNALDHNVLFVAAAGNGHSGKGYDNDTDPRPGVPASYDIANIISVAAIDKDDKLGSFSNWGHKTVDVAAPGVKIYSTMTRNRYGDTVAFGIPWDGTSMATPHVAGAAALVWAAHPNYSALDVKKALLSTVTKISSMDGKSTSGGKINLAAAIQ